MRGRSTDQDRIHMARAVELGRRGWGRVHPNPMVGCVITRDGRILGEGWHREFGGLHAERDALRSAEEAGEEAAGATAYVSLEPCRHFGKTAPCTVALREAGIRRVVFGAEDPGARSGGGAADLARSGLEVVGPLLTPAEARRENPAFFHRESRRPWTALKLALSLDGGIATAPGERTAVSGPEAAEEVHRLRAGFDALLVGAGTGRVDDPLLTVRGPVEPRVPPARVVVDGRGTLAPRARLLREGKGEVHVITTDEAPGEWRRAMEGAGATVHVVPGEGGRVDLPAAMEALRDRGVTALLCEGGGVLGSALLSAGLVDRLHLVVAPRFLGGGGVPAFPRVDPMGGGRWVPTGEPRLVGADHWLVFDREG
jgi:diaminohydroxyphosphoribosylaminopyrimidine deaminase / 5-amino-6-(5-phosphoribosylamino)uracil reductase